MNTNKQWFLSLAKELLTDSFEQLKGSYVIINDDKTPYFGKVLNSSKNNLSIRTIPGPHEKEEGTDLTFSEYYVSDKTHTIIHVEQEEKKYCAKNVYRTAPNKITGHSVAIEFEINKNDSKLESILKNLSPVKTISDVQNIITHISQTYRVPEENISDEKTLGEVLSQNNGFCRHKTALLWIILRTSGFDAKMVYSKEDAESERHSYVIAKIHNKEYILDPTHNLSEQKHTLLKKLRQENKRTIYYEENTPFKIHAEF